MNNVNEHKIKQNGAPPNTTLDLWIGLLLQWTTFYGLDGFRFFGFFDLGIFFWTMSYQAPQIQPL